jgi:hypothetical protein
MFDTKQLVSDALKDRDISSAIHSLIPALKSSDWQKILELSTDLWKFLITTQFIGIYAKQVGRQLAFRLGIKCVPILGWAYVAACFVVALRANYHRFSFG